MPIMRRHLANLAGLTALVRKSAAICSVLQYSKLTSPLRTLSLAKWCITSICLDLCVDMECFNNFSAPWLSPLMQICPISSPKSRASFFNHSASFTALAAPIYSASTVDTATVTCRRLDHDMAPPANINT